MATCTVNGRDLKSPDSIYSFFEADGRQASHALKVGTNADASSSQEVTRYSVDSERGKPAPTLAWIEKKI